MRPLHILFLLVSCVSSLSAQSVLVTYARTENIENQLKNANIPDESMKRELAKDMGKPSYFTLLCTGSESLYKPAPAESQKEELGMPSSGGNIRVQTITIGMADGGTYKNRETKEYISQRDILGKLFLIKDTLPDFHWKILPDTKKIGELQCRKATTEYNGEKIEAWFAPEIPVFDGPEEFYGLPGLIIELKKPDLNYAAVSIKHLDEISEVKPPTKGKPVSQQEYDKTLQERLKILMGGSSGSSSVIRIGGN